MKRNATTYLTRDEIREVIAPSDARGWLSVATTWGIIAAAFALIGAFPRSPLAWIVGVILLGGRQLALAILMHECAHQSLFATRTLNDVVGKWLVASPVWQRLDDYRKHHLAHHGHTSLEGDPDLGLVEAFPTSGVGIARKFLRDLSGVAFIRRTIGLLAMDAGILTYTASTGAKRVDPRPDALTIVKNLAKNFGPVLLTNLVLGGILVAVGHGYLYGAWILANATTFSAFVRLRSIAEHAVTETSEDPFVNTRTTHANVLARLTVAPHHVNYHLEHHLIPTTPHYRLARLHALLRERGAYADAKFAPGYLDVLRQASRTAPTAA